VRAEFEYQIDPYTQYYGLDPDYTAYSQYDCQESCCADPECQVWQYTEGPSGGDANCMRGDSNDYGDSGGVYLVGMEGRNLPPKQLECFQLGGADNSSNLRLDATISTTFVGGVGKPQRPNGETNVYNTQAHFVYDATTSSWATEGLGLVATSIPGEPAKPAAPEVDYTKTMFVHDLNRTFMMAGNSTDANGDAVVSWCHSDQGDTSIVHGQFGEFVNGMPFDLLFSNNRDPTKPRSQCVGDGGNFPILQEPRRIGSTEFRVYQMGPIPGYTPAPGSGLPTMQVEQSAQGGLIPVAYWESGSYAYASEPQSDNYQSWHIVYSEWTMPAEPIPKGEWDVPALCYTSSGGWQTHPPNQDGPGRRRTRGIM
jgi:hypothetical protein